MSVAGLVLAAGSGSRLGRPKALLELDGERLVDRAVRVLGGGGCDPVLVVSGAVALTVPGARVLPNPDWETGMGSSLRVGLGALAREPVDAGDAVHAVVVCLVDQPHLASEAVARLIASGADLAAATYGGRRGHPVLLGRTRWGEVARLATGDTGARAYLAAHGAEIVAVPCDDLGSPEDVDTPADLARLRDSGDTDGRPG